MSFNTALPGISEACGDAVKGVMVANLSALNAMLSRDALTPVPAVVASQIYLGENQTIPQYDLWFALEAGDSSGGEELESDYTYIGEPEGRGFRWTYKCSIAAYVHPDAVFSIDPFAQNTIRHRLLSRLEDWLRIVCFNNQVAQSITLASREYNGSPGYDFLLAGGFTSLSRGYANKGSGRNIVVPCIQGDYVGQVG